MSHVGQGSRPNAYSSACQAFRRPTNAARFRSSSDLSAQSLVPVWLGLVKALAGIPFHLRAPHAGIAQRSGGIAQYVVDGEDVASKAGYLKKCALSTGALLRSAPSDIATRPVMRTDMRVCHEATRVSCHYIRTAHRAACWPTSLSQLASQSSLVGCVHFPCLPFGRTAAGFTDGLLHVSRASEPRVPLQADAHLAGLPAAAGAGGATARAVPR